MKAGLDCLECCIKQALRSGRIATDDPHIQRAIIDETARLIPEGRIDQSPAVLSLPVYEIVKRLSGNPDPYKHLRREQNELALALEPELRALVAQSPTPLETALHLAAAGNIIDLGAMQAEHIDVHQAVEDALSQGFAVDHTHALKDALDSCQDLLFFLDNAGEIVFDKILIEELQKHTRVTAVVKQAPIINDVLLEDAEFTGLTNICEVIDNGGAFIGSPLSLISDAFRARMDAAGVLLGKGQGNYETLDDHPGNVFLILRAKCELVAAHMGVRYGQVALISTRLRHAQQLAAQAAHAAP